jgi:Spy/CpxP family protein refolding chaperone
MLRSALFSVVSLAIALAVPALGCGGTVASEPPVTADTATTRAPIVAAAHGPVKLFGEALGDVPLTTSQRAAIERLASDAESRHAGARTAHQDLLTTLAAQVEAGAVDRAALQPKLDAVAAAMRASQPADRTAFEQLHAILTPDQRSAFVDAVEAHAQALKSQAHGAHAMKQWADDLQLSDDQKAQIKAAMMDRFHNAKHESPAAAGALDEKSGGKTSGPAIMAAFKQDRFVFDEVAPSRDPGAMVGHASDHLLGVAEVAVPLLTPAQRAIAAQKLREKAASPEADGHEVF